MIEQGFFYVNDPLLKEEIEKYSQLDGILCDCAIMIFETAKEIEIELNDGIAALPVFDEPDDSHSEKWVNGVTLRFNTNLERERKIDFLTALGKREDLWEENITPGAQRVWQYHVEQDTS